MIEAPERSTVEPLGTEKSRLPSEIARTQVYASCQYDISAVQIIESPGDDNVLWRDHYPHLEDTYAHNQDTLHDVLDAVDPRIQERVLRGTFEELFTVPPMVEDKHISITQS